MRGILAGERAAQEVRELAGGAHVPQRGQVAQGLEEHAVELVVVPGDAREELGRALDLPGPHGPGDLRSDRALRVLPRARQVLNDVALTDGELGEGAPERRRHARVELLSGRRRGEPGQRGDIRGLGAGAQDEQGLRSDGRVRTGADPSLEEARQGLRPRPRERAAQSRTVGLGTPDRELRSGRVPADEDREHGLQTSGPQGAQAPDRLVLGRTRLGGGREDPRHARRLGPRAALPDERDGDQGSQDTAGDEEEQPGSPPPSLRMGRFAARGQGPPPALPSGRACAMPRARRRAGRCRRRAGLRRSGSSCSSRGRPRRP